MALQPLSTAMRFPASVTEALEALAETGAAEAVAGATWLMRAPLRHEPMPQVLVAFSRIPALRGVEISPGWLKLGPLNTHDDLAAKLPRSPELRAIVEAAGKAANPGVRRMATLGGNLCATAFPASDLATALLCLDAEVEVSRKAGVERMPLATFLARRADRAPPWLLTGVLVPLGLRRSAHERLPMRRAGDYACAILSASLVADEGGLVRDARIAVGAVESAPRRWTRLEAAIEGLPLQPGEIERAAEALTGDFQAREANDAPGWYRLAVLPALARRAFETLAAGGDGPAP